MRVLLVSHRFPPDDQGGVERYTQSLAAELVRLGDQVGVVARRTEPERRSIRLLRERLPNGSCVYRLAGGHVRLEQFLEAHEHLERLFRVAMLESAPDVVHINQLLGLSPRFIHIAHQLGAAVVVSLHDFYFACPRVHLQKPTGDLCDGPDGGRECARVCFANGGDDGALRWGMRAMYYRKALGMADRIIAYSDYVKSYFHRFGGDSRSIEMIPNGVSFDCGDERPPGPGPGRRGALNIAYCGTVAPHKGPHVILEALRTAALPAVELLIIGQIPDPAYGQRLRQMAAAMPGVRLRMYGSYERAELAFLLDGVDCAVFPSLVPEAGPIAPREALTLGVPIVVAGLGALAELVHEGENGFIFNARRPTELAAILRRMAEDDDLMTRLRTGARRSAMPSAAEHTKSVRRVYAEAVEDFMKAQNNRADISDFNFIHDALLVLGCDPSPQA